MGVWEGRAAHRGGRRSRCSGLAWWHREVKRSQQRRTNNGADGVHRRRDGGVTTFTRW
jgi:hypothetical protein